MKQGDSFNCPHCGKSSFLKKISVMDGWKKLGEALSCASCSAKIADIKPPSPAVSLGQGESPSLKKLADFLGTEKLEKPKIDSDGEKHFCRDCAHLIAHPFLTRCGLHQKNVNPMDDCPQFAPKEKEEKH